MGIKKNDNNSIINTRYFIKLSKLIFLTSGFIGLSRNAHDLYHVSNFIVREDFRRKGVGRKLWTAVLDRASGINICVDSGSAMIEWFMKNGFKHKTFLTNYYRITVTEDMKKIGNNVLNIKPLSEELWPSLLKFDRLVYPNYDREMILKAWFTDEDVEVLVAMKDDVVCGYGSIIHRPMDNAYSLRNVFADDEDVLEEMLSNMFKRIPTGSIVCFNMLQNGKLFPKCLKSCGKSYAYSQRLFTKTVVESRWDKICLGASCYT